MPRKKSEEEKAMQVPGFAWRVSLSIIAFFGIIAFFILWLFFYAQAFNIYQNAAVLIVALLIFIAIMGGSWASWGIRYEQKYGKKK